MWVVLGKTNHERRWWNHTSKRGTSWWLRRSRWMEDGPFPMMSRGRWSMIDVVELTSYNLRYVECFRESDVMRGMNRTNRWCATASPRSWSADCMLGPVKICQTTYAYPLSRTEPVLFKILWIYYEIWTNLLCDLDDLVSDLPIIIFSSFFFFYGSMGGNLQINFGTTQIYNEYKI